MEVHVHIKRRFLAVCTAALMLTATFPAATFAAVIAGGGGGNCTDNGISHYIADKQGWNTAAGVGATIDPANTGSQDLCDDPGIYVNNSIDESIQVYENTGCSGNTCEQINLGVIDCDNITWGWVNGGHGCNRDVWHYYAWMVEEGGNDVRVDLGTANSPWQAHDYELIFNYGASTWDMYIDNVYKGGWDVTTSNRDNLNLNIPGHTAIAAWVGERDDQGNAFSYNGVSPWDTADYTNMTYYRGGGNWVLPEHVNCDQNNDPYIPHVMSCDGNGAQSKMRVWSTYSP